MAQNVEGNFPVITLTTQDLRQMPANEIFVQDFRHLIQSPNSTPAALSESKSQQASLPNTNPEPSSGVLTELQEHPKMRCRYFRNILGEAIVKCFHCQYFFLEDDFELYVLQHSTCPVCCSVQPDYE